MNKEALYVVESFIFLLKARAEGSDESPQEYRELRDRVLSLLGNDYEVPKFVYQCTSLPQFWAFIRGIAGTYQERTEAIDREFASLLDALKDDIPRSTNE